MQCNVPVYSLLFMEDTIKTTVNQCHASIQSKCLSCHSYHRYSSHHWRKILINCIRVFSEYFSIYNYIMLFVLIMSCKTWGFVVHQIKVKDWCKLERKSSRLYKIKIKQFLAKYMVKIVVKYLCCDFKSVVPKMFLMKSIILPWANRKVVKSIF